MSKNDYSVFEKYKAINEKYSTFADYLSDNQDEYVTMCKSYDLYIRMLLEHINIPTYLEGYELIVEAIKMLVFNKDESIYLTKNIYPDLAKKFCISSTAVETNIRRAIEACWDTENEFIKLIFRNSKSSLKKRPSNKEFIWTIGYNVMLERSIFS